MSEQDRDLSVVELMKEVNRLFDERRAAMKPFDDQIEVMLPLLRLAHERERIGKNNEQ